MVRIISIQTTLRLFWHGRPFWASLKPGSYAILLLSLLFIFSVGWQSASAAYLSHQNKVEYSAARPLTVTSSNADIVLVVDNINEIKLHDPTGARFLAAQMFVNQAQPGNRIGVLRIPSSDRHSPVKLLDLTTIQKSSDRKTIEQVLTQSFFGPIDPGPTAYFLPALQTASQMLLSAQDNNRKYIIVMTDVPAQSGDQEACSSAPDQYHEWLCEIPRLESHKIAVILYGFTTPGNEAAFKSTQHYLEQHGGIALQVG